MSQRTGAILAALLYLGLALYANRGTLAEPFQRLPLPTRHTDGTRATFYKADQAFVVANIARTARAFSHAPTTLGDPGLCAPMTRPHTLGEHMFGEGLLGAIPFLMTQDPIFTFNAVVVLSIWISAMAMYALAFYWTRSVPAALIAGLLFAFHPQRLNNPGHLFGFGNAWTALALVAIHQVFTRRRWRDAILLTLFVSLQLLESFYQVLALATLGGTYAFFLALRNRQSVRAWGPKVACVAIACGGVAWLVMGPYLETQEAWGLLQGRKRMLAAAPNYLPGYRSSPGWIAFILASLGLLDRLRGPRRLDPNPDDPRLLLALAGFLLFWCSVKWLPIPGYGSVPSLLRLIGDTVPGLSAVRVLAALQFGVWLVFAFFSAYGIVAVLEWLPRERRTAAAALLAAAVILQTFQPTLSRLSFGTTAGLEPYRARPSEPELAQIAKLPPGGVLDVPLVFQDKVRLMPAYLLSAGYHGEPVAACYNSFLSGVQTEVQRLTEALPERDAARALSALGFQSIRFHHRDPAAPSHLRELLADDDYIELVEGTRLVNLYRLKPQPTIDRFDAIANAAPASASIAVDRPRSTVTFELVGPDGPTFRHPDPVEPSEVIVRWRDETDAIAAESRERLLLPLTLVPREIARREITVNVPAIPGAYRAELVRAAQPDLILASRRLTVR